MENSPPENDPLPHRPLRHRLRQHWAVTFLGRRFSKDQYLGLHLTLGMILSLAMLGLFAVIGHNVIGDTELTQFDTRIGLQLQAHRLGSPVFRALFGAITQMGSRMALTCVTVLVALLLLLRRHRLLMLVWLTAVVGGGLLDLVAKHAFDRPRPDFNDLYWVHETSPSFPSGHSTAGLVAYGLLAYLSLLEMPRGQSRAIVPALAVLVLLIGFSRMYLGAHYFSDVAGGFTVGSCWLASVISAIEVVRRRRKHLRALAAAQAPAK